MLKLPRLGIHPFALQHTCTVMPQSLTPDIIVIRSRKHILQKVSQWAITTTVIVMLVMTGCSLKSHAALAAPSLVSQNTSSSLTLNSQGEAVRTLQSRLKNLGYLEEPVSGLYDKATEEAIRTFQANQDLPTDGVAGPKTQELLATASLIDPHRPAMPPDIQRILNRGKLIVAVLGTDNPPFFMADPTKSLDPVGLDINIAHGLADTLGVEIEFNRSATTFNEVVDQVYQLNADIAISKLSRTLSRAQRVRFSQPYVSMRQGLIANRLQLAQQTQNSGGMIQAIRNFQGKVGVIKSSSYVGFLKEKFPQATIVEYAKWEDIVDAVITGDIQAAYRDELEVKKIIRKNPDAALRLQTIALTDTKDQIAMALPWDSNYLQGFVNQYLDTLELDYNADLVLDEYEDYLGDT